MKLDIIDEAFVDIAYDYLNPLFIIMELSRKMPDSQVVSIKNLYSQCFSDDVMDKFFKCLSIYPMHSLTFPSNVGYYYQDYKHWLQTRLNGEYINTINACASPKSGVVETLDDSHIQNLLYLYENKSFRERFQTMMFKNIQGKDRRNTVEVIPVKTKYTLDGNRKAFLFVASNLDYINFCHTCFRCDSKLFNKFFNEDTIKYGFLNSINSSIEQNNFVDEITVIFTVKGSGILIEFYGYIKDDKKILFKLLVECKNRSMLASIVYMLYDVNNMDINKESKCLPSKKCLQKRASVQLQNRDDYGSW